MRVHLIVGAIACAAAFGAQAQYKYIGPDGRVVYSDQPPPPTAKAVEKKAPANPQTAGGGYVPFAVQQAINNFPVILYTAPTCGAPCNDGRNLLNQRGVPFTEKTVVTADDAAAFRKATSAELLPVMMVGSGKQVQFDRDAWTSALNAAGYPANNQLPPAYKNPPPTPIVQAPTPAPGQQTAAGPANGGTAAPPAPPAPPEKPAWFKGF